MTYIMSCVWLDYMVKYFQCKNCVGSSLKTKKCVASFLVPGDNRFDNHYQSGFSFAKIMRSDVHSDHRSAFCCLTAHYTCLSENSFFS